MKIKNLTSSVQALRLVDLVEGREFTIYIEGNSWTDIAGMYLADMTQLTNKFEIMDSIMNVTKVDAELAEVATSEDTAESTDREEISEDAPEEEDKESEEEPVSSLPNKFICDICGAEFASDRGLNSHKSRSHNN